MSRIDVVIRGAGVLVVAGVLAAGGSYVVGGGGGSDTANAFVAASGSCTRQASLVSLATAEANGWTCGTLDAANDVCQNGDTVRVKASVTVGTSSTGTTQITGSNSRSAACVVRPETDGGSITATGIISFDGDWLTVYDLTWTNQTSNAVDDYQQFHVKGDNVSLIRPDSSSFQIWSGSDTTYIEDADVGPCHYDDQPGTICTPRFLMTGPGTPANNVTFKGGVIHHQSSDDTAGACGADTCHTVGLAVFNATNVLIDGVHFYDNKTTNIRIQDRPDGSNDNVTIQNSWFEPTWDNSANPSSDDTSTTVFSGRRLNAIDVDDATPGLLIHFNTFAHRASCPSGEGCGSLISVAVTTGAVGDPAIIRGNLLSGVSSTSCSESSSTVDYDQNVIWPHADGNGPTVPTGVCDSSNTIKAYNFDLPAVSMSSWSSPSTGGHGPKDLHITGAAWSGDDKVTSGCIALDKDGDSRTATCDAGADER